MKRKKQKRKYIQVSVPLCLYYKARKIAALYETDSVELAMEWLINDVIICNTPVKY